MKLKQIAFITILFIAFGCEGKKSDAQSTVSTNKNMESLEASKILSIFINNPSDGDKLYKGKEIVISGLVWDATKDKQTLLLDYRNGEGYGVLCISDFKKLFNDIKAGDKVKVKGICQGMSNKHVHFTNCIVLER